MPTLNWMPSRKAIIMTYWIRWVGLKDSKRYKAVRIVSHFGTSWVYLCLSKEHPVSYDYH